MTESELDLALKQPAIRLWRRLVYTTQGKVREVEAALAPLGLTMTEFDLLAVLRRFDGATQQEVAQRLLFTEANMSYHAKRLVARGLIERQTAGKRKLLRLTDAGQHLVQQALPTVLEIHELQFSDLNDEELKLLRDLLRRLK
ncbi:hypothetical protein GCM10017783_23140 [Deinococcus piscis]|uniref:HTH marR-type domain-containing protein n=1 Tax=Deinococcus piscis TaxID=394230 RepID=A0ABQ3KBN1_9DEIO|nr:MarR family transcriptional regulator [Deinococcus piscis]GHG10020.1 hypothetical protein GCM10017783_23140 [Deinococcus piscis]